MPLDGLDKCQRCPLHEVRLDRALFPVRVEKLASIRGASSSAPRILFVGDNPSLPEVSNGLFTGDEKFDVLMEALKEVGIEKSSVVLGYATRCTVPRPSYKIGKTEITACRPWLYEELAAWPEIRVIVSFGKMATATVLGIPVTKAGAARGEVRELVVEGRKFTVVPTVHLFQVLMSPTEREGLVFDLTMARNYGTPGWAPFSMSQHQTSHAGKYVLVGSEKQLKDCVDDLLKAPLVAFDTETRGLDPWHMPDEGAPFVSSIQFSLGADQAYFIPVSIKEFDQTVSPPGWSRVLGQELRRFFENYKGVLAGFNAKFDQMAVSTTFGVCPRLGFDGMIVDHLKRGMPARSLKKIAWQVSPYGGYEKEKRETDALLEKEGHENDSYFYPLAPLFWYGCLDAEVTWRLAAKHVLEEDSMDARLWFLSDFLAEASTMLTRIEADGWKVDLRYLEQYGELLRGRRVEVAMQVRMALGPALEKFETAFQTKFLLTSNQHLRTMLYEILALSPTRETPKGAASTSRLALEEIKERHPVVPFLLESRKLEKLYSAFYERWLKGVAKDERLHFHYNLISYYNEAEGDGAGAITGRLSSSGAAGNVQQIPKQAEIRRVFIPDDEDSIILDIDFANLEYVVTAIHSAEEKLVAAFKQGYDIHSAVAAELFGKTPEEMKLPENKAYRQKAKTTNFGLLYGMGPQKLAASLGLSDEEARVFMDDYFSRYPGLLKWIKRVKRFAEVHGYCESRFGRRRMLPDARLPDSGWESKGRKEAALRQAVNSPVQGDASDVCLYGLVRLSKWLDDTGKRARIKATVHDSIVLSVPVNEFLEVALTAREILEHPNLPFIDGPKTPGVPLRVSGSEGPTWGDCTDFEFD